MWKSLGPEKSSPGKARDGDSDEIVGSYSEISSLMGADEIECWEKEKQE